MTISEPEGISGAESLIQTLIDSGVDTCFANPGTSEMHFVAALDKVPAMRPVLGLFEGTVTGMADGYGRMADKPAVDLAAPRGRASATASPICTMRGARRRPIVNVVGDHATYHQQWDTPLKSDIDGAGAAGVGLGAQQRRARHTVARRCGPRGRGGTRRSGRRRDTDPARRHGLGPNQPPRATDRRPRAGDRRPTAPSTAPWRCCVRVAGR